MNSLVRFILGIAFFALLLVYSAASFYVWLYPPGSDAGWYFSDTYGVGEFQVTQIDPQGPAQELRPGDKIIAIDLNVDGRIVKGEPSLAALSVGRFLPALARTSRVKMGKGNMPVKKDLPPARRTRSIYIRPANHQ